MKGIQKTIILTLIVIITIFTIYSHIHIHAPSQVTNLSKTTSMRLYQMVHLKNPNVVRILSLDGGGVRGVITLEVLKYLEEKTGKPTAQLFDVFSATSTGAIIASALLSPNADGKPKFSAADLLNQYQQQAKIIFSSSVLHKISTLNGLIGPKYSNTNKENYFIKQVGNAKYSDLLKAIIIPCYETKLNEPIYFYSWRSIAKQFYTWQVVSGCTSPPSYFPPVKLQSIDKKNKYTVMDGAIFANNPAIIALTHVLANFPKKQYILVSIGTGTLRPNLDEISIRHWGRIQWMQYILGLMLSSQSEDISHSIYYLKARMVMPELHYYRLNIELPAKNYVLDDVHQKNMTALKKYGKEVVEENKATLDLLAKELSNDVIIPDQPDSNPAIYRKNSLSILRAHYNQSAHLPHQIKWHR